MKLEISICNENGLVLEELWASCEGTGIKTEEEFARFIADVIEDHFDTEAE